MSAGVSLDLNVHWSGNGYAVTECITAREIAGYADAAEAVQAAVDRLSPAGGEVHLQPGRYELGRAIRLANNVTLAGSGRGTELRLSADAEPAAAVLGDGVDRACVRNLTVSGTGRKDTGSGVILDDCGDCELDGLFVLDFPECGIWLRNNTFLSSVHDCSLTANAQAAIRCQQLANHGRGGSYLPNRIAGCTVYAGGTGIECDRAIVVNITGCQAFQTAGPAYHIRNTSNSVLISGCRTFQCEADAVVVENSHEINVTGNIICWQRGGGVVFRGVQWGSFTGNNVIDSGGCQYNNPRKGVLLEAETRGMQVTGNAVFNWGGQGPMTVGIHEDATCEMNVVASNNVNFCTEDLVRVEGKGSIERDNVGRADEALLGHPSHPDFEFGREPMQAFAQAYRDRFHPRKEK